MSLSSDKLNGHPTERDPEPDKRGRVIRNQTGWPAARKAQQRKREAGTPTEQKRRVELAARNRERAIQRTRNLKMLEIYDIPQPVKVPGDKRLFSRWLKEKKDKKVRFENLAQFCLYVLENYGDDEKDEQWRGYLAAADPQGDAEEQRAEETQAVLTAIDTQGASVPALASDEIPSETFAPQE